MNELPWVQFLVQGDDEDGYIGFPLSFFYIICSLCVLFLLLATWVMLQCCYVAWYKEICRSILNYSRPQLPVMEDKDEQQRGFMLWNIENRRF